MRGILVRGMLGRKWIRNLVGIVWQNFQEIPEKKRCFEKFDTFAGLTVLFISSKSSQYFCLHSHTTLSKKNLANSCFSLSIRKKSIFKKTSAAWWGFLWRGDQYKVHRPILKVFWEFFSQSLSNLDLQTTWIRLDFNNVEKFLVAILLNIV